MEQLPPTTPYPYPGTPPPDVVSPRLRTASRLLLIAGWIDIVLSSLVILYVIWLYITSVPQMLQIYAEHGRDFFRKGDPFHIALWTVAAFVAGIALFYLASGIIAVRHRASDCRRYFLMISGVVQVVVLLLIFAYWRSLFAFALLAVGVTYLAGAVLKNRHSDAATPPGPRHDP